MKPSTKLSSAEIAKGLKSLPGWQLVDGGGAIVREYATDGWPTTLMLVNAIGFFAEAADHHPDLAVSWGKVQVKLSTHSAGGVTASDMELAAIIERTAPWRPPTGSALRGTTKKFVDRGSP
ncbi:MAG TPA: 4a-hydroxytetrahydrobiopterin dehydratase [Gemmatimonadales bacterium]|nr:4a-hydroxytetrahydrobiopterin dehydratase [Gemmatimonadales bacterium]